MSLTSSQTGYSACPNSSSSSHGVKEKKKVSSSKASKSCLLTYVSKHEDRLIEEINNLKSERVEDKQEISALKRALREKEKENNKNRERILEKDKTIHELSTELMSSRGHEQSTLELMRQSRVQSIRGYGKRGHVANAATLQAIFLEHANMDDLQRYYS